MHVRERSHCYVMVSQEFSKMTVGDKSEGSVENTSNFENAAIWRSTFAIRTRKYSRLDVIAFQ
jgi:hypothetical protein